MADGERQMGNCGWQMANAKWEIEEQKRTRPWSEGQAAWDESFTIRAKAQMEMGFDCPPSRAKVLLVVSGTDYESGATAQ